MISTNIGDRDRLARLVVTAVLSIFAVDRLVTGKRITGIITGLGAVVVGFTATTRFCAFYELLGIDTTDE